MQVIVLSECKILTCFEGVK